MLYRRQLLGLAGGHRGEVIEGIMRWAALPERIGHVYFWLLKSRCHLRLLAPGGTVFRQRGIALSCS